MHEAPFRPLSTEAERRILEREESLGGILFHPMEKEIWISNFINVRYRIGKNRPIRRVVWRIENISRPDHCRDYRL